MCIRDSSYFDALTGYREGDPAAIVERFAHASLAAVDGGRRLASAIGAIRAGWGERIQARRDAAAWELADLLIRQPVVHARLVQEELDATSANAHRALRQLVEAGVLTEITGRKRNRLWQARDVLNALDDFTAHSPRR